MITFSQAQSLALWNVHTLAPRSTIVEILSQDTSDNLIVGFRQKDDERGGLQYKLPRTGGFNLISNPALDAAIKIAEAAERAKVQPS